MMFNQGKLVTWKDDQGFGFIKPDDQGKQVFLHISVLNKAIRRPQVGDIILYEKAVQPDGKIRAAKATIQGVELLHSANKQKLKQFARLKNVVGIILIIAAIVPLRFVFSGKRSPSLTTSTTKFESTT